MTHYPKFFLNKGKILQYNVQIIGILEEVHSFYWPKMHLWKGDKKIGQGPPPAPHLDKIQKTSNFFSWNFPSYVKIYYLC